MPVVSIQEFAISGDDRSTANYDAMSERIGASAIPPSGLIVHTAGWDEEAGVFRILVVWETQEEADRFRRERLIPAIEQGPANPDNTAPPDRDGSYQLHNLVRGT